MKLLFVLSLIGAICAQYAQEQPSYQAPSGGYPSGGYYPFPHHHHHYSSSSSSGSRSRSRSSSSESRSDSSESHEHRHRHCKKECKKLENYYDPTIPQLIDAHIRYIDDKKSGCRNAIVKCPQDYNIYGLIAANNIWTKDGKAIGLGQFLEREVKCHNGKWQALATNITTYTDFKYVTCTFYMVAPTPPLPGVSDFAESSPVFVSKP